MLRAKYNQDSWKRINMRNVSHLLAVEFMHDLYNRHITRLNSVRFRNTITIWKDGVVNSYAPIKEWEDLGNWLGYRYFNLDKILIKETELLINRDRSYLEKYLTSIEKKDLSSLSERDLAVELLNLQSITLGELYSLNFVQVEHGLFTAITKLLKEIYPSYSDAEIFEIFSTVITAKELTESQKEEQEFISLVRKAKRMNIKDPREKKEVLSWVKSHYAKYSYMYSAYGEDRQNINFYINRFKSLAKIDSHRNIKKEVQDNYANAKEALAKIDNSKLNILVELMSTGGTFRDKNKSDLGQTIRFRFNILDEVANRGIEERESLNFYLMSEIVDLLDFGAKLNKIVIKERKKRGVILTRFEELNIWSSDIVPNLTTSKGKDTSVILQGVCASAGVVEGECKVVITKSDMKKVKKGNIMVAIGTDFDLMDAIHRAAAVITEEGGLLSHASVVCRELKKPCIISVENATNLLPDGTSVKLDATNGTIEKTL